MPSEHLGTRHGLSSGSVDQQLRQMVDVQVWLRCDAGFELAEEHVPQLKGNVTSAALTPCLAPLGLRLPVLRIEGFSGFALRVPCGQGTHYLLKRCHSLRQGFFAVRELVFGVERDAKTILCARPHCSCHCTACTLLRCAVLCAHMALDTVAHWLRGPPRRASSCIDRVSLFRMSGARRGIVE
jgi:hypothetical protein